MKNVRTRKTTKQCHRVKVWIKAVKRMIRVKVRTARVSVPLKANLIDAGVKRRPKKYQMKKLTRFNVVPRWTRANKFYNDIWWSERKNLNRIDSKLGARLVVDRYDRLFCEPPRGLNFMLLKRRVGYYYEQLDYVDWQKQKGLNDWWEGEQRFLQNMHAAESLNPMEFTDTAKCILEISPKTWEEAVGKVAPKVSGEIERDTITNGGTETMVAKKKITCQTIKPKEKTTSHPVACVKSAPEKRKSTGAGRPVGKTLELGIQATWCYVFNENSKPEGVRRTDVEISKFMKSEFKERNSAVFDKVAGVRSKYNSGGFHDGDAPRYCPVINTDGSQGKPVAAVNPKVATRTKSKVAIKSKEVTRTRVKATPRRSNPATTKSAPAPARPKMVRRGVKVA